MNNKTYEIKTSETNKIVNQLLDICMEMQTVSGDEKVRQFTDLVKNLSGLVDKLDQDDISQMMFDLRELVNNSIVGEKDEETIKLQSENPLTWETLK